MQAGDRQDVGEARIAHGLGDVLVDGGLLAGQQRRGHAAFRSGQRGQDARRDVGAQPVDGAHDAVGPAVLDDRGRRQRIAHAAQLLVPGDALEIEGAGCGRSGRRREVGEHQQPVADMDRRRALGERDAHARRHHLDRRHVVAFEAHRLEHDPHALRQALDVGDAALDIDAEQRPAEGRRGQARGTPGHEAKTGGGGDRADGERPGEAARPREEDQDERARGQHRPQPQRRLARQLEIDRDAQPHRHRQPQHPAAALGVELIEDPGACPRHAVSLRCLTGRKRSPTYGALFRPKCGKTRTYPEQ